MPLSKEILKQVQKWDLKGNFLKHTAYSIDKFVKLLDKDENILGFITAKAKAPEPYSGFYTRWDIILTTKRLFFLSKGDGKSIYVDSVVHKSEIPLENLLSVKKRKGFFSNKIIIYPHKDVIKGIPSESYEPFFNALSFAIRETN